MRLIDADAFKDMLEAYGILDGANLIADFPTAFDVDKVVEDLEELRDGNYDFDCCPYMDTKISCDKCHMIRAIDVVRHGGYQV